MRYLVHIGYPKAISTWLQTLLFSGNDPRIQPLASDKPMGAYQKSGGLLFFNTLLEDDNGKPIKLIEPFNFDVAAVKKSIAETTSKDAEVTCLSSEAWTGHPFSGGVFAKEIGERIKQVLPDAKILISIRRQEDAILSAYSHYIVETGGICSLESFLNHKFHDQIPSFSPYYYCYDRLITFYKELFGDNNVLALPMELLSNNGKDEYLAEIYKFLDLTPDSSLEDMEKKNVRDYSSYVILKKFPLLNLLWYPHPANGNAAICQSRIRNGIVRLIKPFISQENIQKSLDKDKEIIAQYIKPYAAPSNKELQKHSQYDLKALGYTI